MRELDVSVVAAAFPKARTEVVIPNSKLWQICRAANPNHPADNYASKRFLALDPGETTGVCFWDGHKLSLTQWDTRDIGTAFNGLMHVLLSDEYDHVRYEDYKVYAWKTADHSFASLHTPQWIGAIRVACHLADVIVSEKMAQQAKAFWTDGKLKLCDLYEAGLKHARDAERHMLFMMAFPNS